MPGWVVHGAVHGLSGPGHGNRLLAALVGGDLDVVVLAGAAAPLRHAPDALPDAVELLLRARPRQPLVQGFKVLLEALGKTLGDTALLLGTLFGIAVQPHLPTLGVIDLVQVNRPRRGACDGPWPPRRRTGADVRG